MTTPRRFVEKELFKAADVRKRKELLDNYVRSSARRGDGVREALFYFLDRLEANEANISA